MEFEFDKEIDVLLRQAARGDMAAAELAGTHLDADEINAFAEQLLSDKARFRAIEHLADCSRCRNILSNLAAFNAASESEIVHAKESLIEFMPTIPWYKKLFTFPQIAYAMGITALIFGGIIAVIILKDSSRNASSDIAQIEQRDTQNAFSSGEPASSMTATGSTNTANMSMNTNSATYANSNASMAAPKSNRENQVSSIANSNLSEVQNKDIETSKPTPKSAEEKDDKAELSEKEKSADKIAAAPPAAVVRQNPYTVDGEITNSDSDAPKKSESSQNSVAQNQTTNQSGIMPDTRNAQSQRVNRRAEPVAGAAAPTTSRQITDLSKTLETKSIDGKTFRRSDGVWYDVNYRNQKTINLRRNSDDYKKLDANLRSIADKLGGVVVIVFGDKAYRIQ